MSTDETVVYLFCQDTYRKIQIILHSHLIVFATYILPEDRILKVVLRVIPTYISENEIKLDLEIRSLTVKIVKRFSPKFKLIPICLIIIKKVVNMSQIYEINTMFYIRIKVTAYKKRSLVVLCLSAF